MVERPDLTIYGQGPYVDGTSASSTYTVGSGHALTVDYAVVNQGLGDALQPWSNQVYLSRDTVLDSGDSLLKTDQQTSDMIGQIPGQLSVLGFIDQGLVIPAGAGAGIWHLILKIDSGNQVDETPFIPGANNGKNNNVIVGQTIMVGAPDLQVSTPTVTLPTGASAASPGGTVSVTFTVTNGGAGDAAGPWTDKVYLSVDGTLDAGDPLVDTINRSSGVVSGATYTISNESVTIPGSTAPGTYRLFVKTDADNAVAEASETNNAVASVTFPVSVITVAPATLPVPTLDDPYSQTITASGGTGSYSFSVSAGSLPTGLSLDAGTGVLSGTPTTPGAYSFTIKATDGNAATGIQPYSGTIAPIVVTLSPATLPTGVATQSYSQAVSATGGHGPYTFTVSAGALPTGLSLDSSTGVISGTPSVIGPFSVTIKATDAYSRVGTQGYTIGIGAPPIAVSPATLPDGTTGQAYSQTITASGGVGPYTFAVTLGSLPTGLSLNPNTGVLSGTPTAAGPFSFTITANDSVLGASGHRDYAISVAFPPITVAPASLPDGTVGHPYSQTITGSGGTSPYSFSVVVGSLPDGLSLDSATGVLSGTPTTGGPASFRVRATDTNGAPGTRDYTVNIATDSVPPVTSANATPAANAHGWNKTDVSVALSATDNDSGVHAIVFDTGGPTTTVPGSSASVSVTTEGVTTVSYHAVDNAGNVETTKTLIVRIDKTKPAPTCAGADAAWHATNVSLACTATDGGSGLANAADAAFSLSTSVVADSTDSNAATGSRVVCDLADNCSIAGPIAGNKIDRQAPAITITTPPVGAVYTLNQVVTSAFSCIDAGVGGGTCSGPATVTTSSVGAKTFTVTATDALGNTTTKSAAYSVKYTFTGFFMISSTNLNSAEAGDGITLWFSLGGNRGTAIFATGQPISTPINCTTRVVSGAPAATSGALGYTWVTGWYGYRWNTPSAWRNTCRRFSVTLNDGTTHTADFKFR